jgi:hypothetical protein
MRHDALSGSIVDAENDERELNTFKMQLYMGSVFGPASLLNQHVGHTAAMRAADNKPGQTIKDEG